MANVDTQLVTQVQQGDRKAFAMLVARYERPMYNTAYRMMHNADDAADVTQTAFTKAFEKIHTYDPSYKFFNWLYRITVNESLNTINRRKRRRDFEYDPPARIPTPDEDYLLTEMGSLLQSALDAMSFDHRVVIVLKHLMLLSYGEISQILEIPEKTVKSRLYAARQALRKQLVRQGFAG
jgi:RNA polymerase sigma-70 factor (ECF subfamily)